MRVMLLAVLVALSTHAQAHAQARCYGAAARDPAKRCTTQTLTVTPSPADGAIQPNAPCTPVSAPTPPQACAFGTPNATPTVALLGDSHAVHWRAALDVVARRHGWRALTLYQSGCPFTAAYSALGPPHDANCLQFKRDVATWFARHPEITTVFVSGNAGAPTAIPPGADRFATKVDGFATAWNALPPTVTRIFVLRDVPRQRVYTPGCVERAVRRHREPGRTCAVPRATALPPDPALAAAQQVPRAVTLDLTRFMCDSLRCFPVIGGVLVHKDVGHLTRTFAATLAPYVEQELSRRTARRSPPRTP